MPDSDSGNDGNGAGKVGSRAGQCGGGSQFKIKGQGDLSERVTCKHKVEGGEGGTMSGRNIPN